MRSKMLTWPDVATTATVLALVQGGTRLSVRNPLRCGLLLVFPRSQRRNTLVPMATPLCCRPRSAVARRASPPARAHG